MSDNHKVTVELIGGVVYEIEFGEVDFAYESEELSLGSILSGESAKPSMIAIKMKGIVKAEKRGGEEDVLSSKGGAERIVNDGKESFARLAD